MALDVFDLCRLVVQYGDAEEVGVAVRILSGARRARRETSVPRLARSQSAVYFVASEGFMKIESAAAHGEDVLGTVAGSIDEHRRLFSRWNAGGDRFVLVPPVLSLVRKLCAGWAS
jgi:hypothetical protein